MDKNCFWNLIDSAFDKSENNELGIAFSKFGYIDKETKDFVEINYQDEGVSFDDLVSLLQTLANEDKIELIDTENMGYFIYRKAILDGTQEEISKDLMRFFGWNENDEDFDDESKSY